MVLFSALSYAKGFSIEARGYYFQPTDQYFKDIYGKAVSFGGEIGINVWKGVNIWIGGDYLSKKGKLTFTEEETELQVIPITCGVRFQFTESGLIPYVGIGIGYFKYKETNPIDSVEKGDVGYIGKVGCFFKIMGGLFFDIEGSYSYCRVKPAEVEADLGGLKAGIGLGFEF